MKKKKKNNKVVTPNQCRDKVFAKTKSDKRHLKFMKEYCDLLNKGWL